MLGMTGIEICESVFIVLACVARVCLLIGDVAMAGLLLSAVDCK